MTKSDYWVTIPIYSSVTVLLDEEPSGLSHEEILAKLDFEAILPCAGEVYPTKAKEVCFEALDSIEHRAQEIEIEEDVTEDGQVRQVAPPPPRG